MKILKINDVLHCAARAQGVFQHPARQPRAPARSRSQDAASAFAESLKKDAIPTLASLSMRDGDRF